MQLLNLDTHYPKFLTRPRFNKSKLGIKISRTLYVAFDRNNNFLGTATHTPTNNPTVLIEGDYQYICEIIRGRVANGLPLTTITGLNKVFANQNQRFKG